MDPHVTVTFRGRTNLDGLWWARDRGRETSDAAVFRNSRRSTFPPPCRLWLPPAEQSAQDFCGLRCRLRILHHVAERAADIGHKNRIPGRALYPEGNPVGRLAERCHARHAAGKSASGRQLREHLEVQYIFWTDRAGAGEVAYRRDN